MAIEFRMPQLGESVVEGTIGKWLRQVGDPVQEFEPLLEVETDKVNTEIPSPASGIVLDLRAREGETVKIGQVIAVIGRSEEASGASPPPAAATHSLPQEVQAPGHRPGGRGYLTPVVARLAAEHGVDTGQLVGSGRQGRVTKRDLLRHLQQGKAAPVLAGDTAAARPAAEGAGPLVPAGPVPSREAPVSPPGAVLEAGDLEVPLSKVRQSIVRHMRLAKDTAAHVTTFMEVDLSRVQAYRNSHRAEFEAEGVKLTYTPFFLEALVKALKAYPMLNAVLAGDKMIYKRQIHLGIAVDLGEEGLIVPVVKNADDKNLRGLARAVNDLAARARSRSLLPEEVQGATFTLTNHGITGSLAGTPIIPIPQIGILGVGAIQKRAVVMETEWGDSIAIRPMAYLSLSFDHRAIDGATADRFLATAKQFLEFYG